MKRFYKLVTRHAVPGGFEIHLDGKPVKTPAGKTLLASRPDLADAVVREWATQESDIIPDSMPVTQILITALDRVARERETMERAVLAYLDTDLLCYRAAQPVAVAAKQKAAWDPWLAWFREKYNAALLTTDGLQALKQPAAAHDAAKKAVNKLNDLEFTILQLIVSLSGSLVLGLAFTANISSAGQIFAAIHVEEIHKEEIYNAPLHGLAPHEERKRAALIRDLTAASLFLA